MNDAFEFYPCLVDDRPASIYVNLRYEQAPLDEAATRYEIVIRMHEPGEHGIGSETEGLTLDALETALVKRGELLGLVYVGRLRHRGLWESTFYGPADRTAALRRLAGELSAELAGGRRVDVDAALDRDWRYYRELLLPDAERRRWMDDRRLVQVLQEQGDSPSRPRPVDHRAVFATAAARTAFVAAADRLGFTLLRVRDDGIGEQPFVAEVQRVDPIELDHIHDVVMTLVDVATEHGGAYEGWIAGVER